MAKGDQFEYPWWYNINNYVEQGGRSGYEHFEDGNNNYIIAQFIQDYVYDNVEGWQNTVLGTKNSLEFEIFK